MSCKFVSSLALISFAFTGSATAKDLAVPIGKCDKPIGSAYVEQNVNTANFQKAGASKPSGFLEAVMVPPTA